MLTVSPSHGAEQGLHSPCPLTQSGVWVHESRTGHSLGKKKIQCLTRKYFYFSDHSFSKRVHRRADTPPVSPERRSHSQNLQWAAKRAGRNKMIPKTGQYKNQTITKAVQKTQISAMSSGNASSIKNYMSVPGFSHLPVTTPPPSFSGQRHPGS